MLLQSNLHLMEDYEDSADGADDDPDFEVDAKNKVTLQRTTLFVSHSQLLVGRR